MKISSRLQTKSAGKGGKILSSIALVSLGLLIFSAPVNSQSKTLPNSPIVIAQKRSLPSETTLISQYTGSGGSLTVSNGTNQDAFVKLVEPASGTLVAEFFVESGSSFRQEQIPDGVYKVLFVLGNNWNANTQSFTKNKRFAKFDKPLNFTTTQVSDGIEYRAFKITLHSVSDGNASTSRVNEREFNRY
jgi:hypothetical protein